VVDRAFDGEEGHYLGESEPYDAVILDIGLPKMDGVSVLESWRRAGRSMPVLILTARDRWSDKVQGFDAGADDYVAKPFHLEEVLARIRALLRRSAGHAKSEFTCGPVRLDTRTGRVTVDGNPVKLTSHEYRLLSYLMHHAGRWSRVPNWWNIFTTRTSTAIPTPSRFSSAVSARSSTST
jgi:two-component system OmpR family response regulator